MSSGGIATNARLGVVSTKEISRRVQKGISVAVDVPYGPLFAKRLSRGSKLTFFVFDTSTFFRVYGCNARSSLVNDGGG